MTLKIKAVKSTRPVKLDKLTTLVAKHKLLTGKEPKCANLKLLLDAKTTVLATPKMLSTLQEDSAIYVKHLRERMKVISKYVDTHKKMHGDDEITLPPALHKEWTLFSTRNHELAQMPKLARAAAKVQNPQLRQLIENHRSQVSAMYAEADRVFTESGLTFAKVEAREVA